VDAGIVPRGRAPLGGAPRGGAKNRPFLRELLKNFKSEKELWLLSIPVLFWVGLFCYYPMYGVLMAFFNYLPGKALFATEFVGLAHFRNFIGNPVFLQLLRNTLAMSLLGLTAGFAAPIVFSLMLNELPSRRGKKLIQTISYLPYFISWIAAGSMIYAFLSSDGLINDLGTRLGLIENPVPFLSIGKNYWAIFTIANIWKGLGWSSIIYLSAITGVDASLYEACSIDGAGRWGMMWHVTLPGIRPTIVMLWILGIGGILNAGFDQHLVLGNPSTQAYWDVLDTYVYRYGIQNGNYSMATAVSLMKSLIGFALVFVTNRISRRVLEVSLF
jgi:putative aldouronate transport system permease protein